MFEILLYILGIVTLFTLVVGIHEFGHLIIARYCKVGVYEYSLGFGPILLEKKSSSGVAYRLRAIPFGGYVRMHDKMDKRLRELLDRRDELIALRDSLIAQEAAERSESSGVTEASERPESEEIPMGFVEKDGKTLPNGTMFQEASLTGRVAILIGGPLANFVLSFFLYWMLFTTGVDYVSSVVGDVVEGSAVERAQLDAGDRIIAVDGIRTETLYEVALALLNYLGDEPTDDPSESISLEVEREGFSGPLSLSIPLSSWDQIDAEENLIVSIGIIPQAAIRPSVVGTVDRDSPADGFMLPGDRIVKLDGMPVRHWLDLMVISEADGPILFEVERGAELISMSITPHETTLENGEKRTVIGISPAATEPAAGSFVTIKRPFYLGWIDALIRTYRIIESSIVGLQKLIVGAISLTMLSGPVGIAQVAGESATSDSLSTFLRLIAVVSIGIGVVNLLPIPLLDGGRVVQALAERIATREFSEKTLLVWNSIGLAMLGSLFILTLIQDIYKLF